MRRDLNIDGLFLLATALGTSLGHFLVQLLLQHQWSTAIERSFISAATLLTVYIVAWLEAA